MKIVCDSCSTKYSIADEKVRGKVFKIKCKKCGHIIVVKGTEGSSPGAPAAGFDQKDTRVFDYSGFDGQGAPASAPAPASAEAIWYVVVDREQVGPMTVAEVHAKVAAGQCDQDTYAWREGMGDWQRLGNIAELAGSAPKPVPAPEPLRSAPRVAEAAVPAASSAVTGRADPADLFAAAAAGEAAEVDADAAQGGLFGNVSQRAAAAPLAAAPEPGAEAVFSSASVARRPVPKDDLFALAASADGGMAAAPSSGDNGHVDVRQMTAQRNENSVLFSLNNLAALASDAPKAGGVAAPVVHSTGGSEGSGLIDIRAMAAMTLGSKRDDAGARLRASEDDLPVFSASAFAAQPSGVLLPTMAQAKPNRMMYAFYAGFGVLALAVIILGVLVVKGLGNKQTTSPGIAELAPPAPTAGDVPPLSKTPSLPDEVPAAPQGTPSPVGKAAPPAPAASVVTPAPAAPPKEDRAAKPAKDSRSSERSSRNEREKSPEVRTPPPERTVAKPPTGSKCDEVACLVDSSLPCCKKGGSSSSSSSSPSRASGDSGLPDSLSRTDIQSGMSSVRGRVMACNDEYKVPGTVIAKITISGSGEVSSAKVEGKFSGTPSGSCVERAVRNARFKKWKGPSVVVTYPFSFR